MGDSGLHEDPLLGHGMSNAFRDAQWLAAAIDLGLSGARPMEAALADYERERDQASMAQYDRNWRAARLQRWDKPEHLLIRSVVRGNPEEASQYIGTYAQVIAFEEFFAPGNIMRILGGVPAL